MLEFLKKVGISESLIDEMLNNIPISSLQDINNNEENCLKIILYLENMGVTNIDDLLLYKPDSFKGGISDFVKKFEKYSNKEFIKELNNDFTLIDLLWK